MTNITKTAVYSGAWNAIYNVLVDNMSTLDPKGRFKKNIVLANMPKPSSPSHPGFPFVVLHPVDMSQSDRAMRSSMSQLNYVIVAEVFGSASPSDVDSLSDTLVSVLYSNLNTLSTSGIKQFTIDSSAAGKVLVDGAEAWVRVISMSFKWRLDLNG